MSLSTGCEIVRQPLLHADDRESMLALHRRYFCGVARHRFLRDLAEKDWVIRLRRGGALVGFSTLQLLEQTIAGRKCHFLFSGDTIVDRSARQSTALAGAFGHVMVRFMREHGEKDLYWFLISKGYRTYRFLPVFFHDFYPACDRPTPAPIARLLHAVARRKFGATYDRAAGVIRPDGPTDRLRPSLRTVPETRRSDPYVEFFLAKNPGYVRGEELACLTPITKRNLNRYAWRVIQQNAVRWGE